MSDPRPNTNEHFHAVSPSNYGQFETACEQFREYCYLYNEAIGSYNTHLDNHRDRRALHDVPFRSPITAHDSFDDAIAGDFDAMQNLLTHLLNESHKDSSLRCHPRTYPIHIEACEHLQIAREQLISILEEILLLSRTDENTKST